MSIPQILITAWGMIMKLVMGCIVLALCGASLPVLSQAAVTHYELNIPRESLDEALKEFARQTGLQVARFSEVTRDSGTAGPVMGHYTSEEALQSLLANSGLSYRVLTARTIAIVPRNKAAASPQSASSQDSEEAQKNSFWERFRVAQVDQGTALQPSSVTSTTSTTQEGLNKVGLEEVVVTAQKREERLQDVPIPVTVVSGATLTQTNQSRLQDYYTQVPGLNMTTGVANEQFLTIRGISSGTTGNAPTVGVTVDDVPSGGSFSTSRVIFPDIDPSDLARVEVLRGPQGTLYGASSMGGLIKFVTVDPSTDGYSGRVQAGTSDVYNGAEPGYNFRAAVNVPLSDTFAIRASGFTREEPGYIDNVETGQKGINEQHASGGHLAAMWRPSEDWSVKLSALYQDLTADGANDVDILPGLGNFQQFRAYGSGDSDVQVQAYSAELNAKLGGVDLVSVSGYNINDTHGSRDFSSSFAADSQKYFGVTGDTLPDHWAIAKFSQEIRLSGSLWQKVDWLLGGFYTHEHTDATDVVLAENPVTGAPAGTLLYEDYPSSYAEYAGFADLTYHVNERFAVQIGGRQSHISEVSAYTGTGLLFALINPQLRENANAFTYLLTPQFKISPNFMVYARLASGYRPGGANTPQVSGAPIQPTFGPDKTQNYEVGAKADLFNHMLSVDASLYRIDWKNMQTVVEDIVGGVIVTEYTINANAAKSEGVELSATLRPLAGLTIASWIDYDNAALVSGFPANASYYGVAGNRLPFSSRWSGNLSLNQDFPLWGSVNGFVGAMVSVVGDRVGDFQATSVRQNYPAYTKTDLRSGVKYNSWTIDAYVNNLADTRGLISGGLDYFPPATSRTYIQPRTVGVNVTKTF